jgi:oligopeptide/dipeptide ABC transporter ATP-binding protein
VAVMYRGRIVEHGPALAVLDHPAHPYTAALVTASALRTLVATDDADSKAAPPDTLHGCAYRMRCPRADARCEEETPESLPHTDHRRLRCHHPLEVEIGSVPTPLA